MSSKGREDEIKHDTEEELEAALESFFRREPSSEQSLSDLLRDTNILEQDWIDHGKIPFARQDSLVFEDERQDWDQELEDPSSLIYYLLEKLSRETPEGGRGKNQEKGLNKSLLCSLMGMGSAEMFVQRLDALEEPPEEWQQLLRFLRKSNQELDDQEVREIGDILPNAVAFGISRQRVGEMKILVSKVVSLLTGAPFKGVADLEEESRWRREEDSMMQEEDEEDEDENEKEEEEEVRENIQAIDESLEGFSVEKEHQRPQKESIAEGQPLSYSSAPSSPAPLPGHLPPDGYLDISPPSFRKIAHGLSLVEKLCLSDSRMADYVIMEGGIEAMICLLEHPLATSTLLLRVLFHLGACLSSVRIMEHFCQLEEEPFSTMRISHTSHYQRLLSLSTARPLPRKVREQLSTITQKVNLYLLLSRLQRQAGELAEKMEERLASSDPEKELAELPSEHLIFMLKELSSLLFREEAQASCLLDGRRDYLREKTAYVFAPDFYRFAGSRNLLPVLAFLLCRFPDKNSKLYELVAEVILEIASLPLARLFFACHSQGSFFLLVPCFPPQTLTVRVQPFSLSLSLSLSFPQPLAI